MHQNYILPETIADLTNKYMICINQNWKRPGGRVVSAPEYGSRGLGFETRWRLMPVRPLIITHSSSRHYLNNVHHENALI